MSDMIRCPYCKGSGEKYGLHKTYRCPACQGTGQVPAPKSQKPNTAQKLAEVYTKRINEDLAPKSETPEQVDDEIYRKYFPDEGGVRTHEGFTISAEMVAEAAAKMRYRSKTELDDRNMPTPDKPTDSSKANNECLKCDFKGTKEALHAHLADPNKHTYPTQPQAGGFQEALNALYSMKADAVRLRIPIPPSIDTAIQAISAIEQKGTQE